MKNKGKPEIKNIHKILLAIGLAFIIIGILLQIFLIQKTKVNIAVLRSVIITFVGSVVLYFACIKRYSMWRFSIGLFLTLGGLFFVIVDTCFNEFDIKTLWPVLVSLAGFSYFGSYFFKKTNNNFHNYSICCLNSYGRFVFVFLTKHHKRLFYFCCNKPIPLAFDNFWCCSFWVFFLCPIWKTTYKSGPHRR